MLEPHASVHVCVKKKKKAHSRGTEMRGYLLFREKQSCGAMSESVLCTVFHAVRKTLSDLQINGG